MATSRLHLLMPQSHYFCTYFSQCVHILFGLPIPNVFTHSWVTISVVTQNCFVTYRGSLWPKTVLVISYLGFSIHRFLFLSIIIKVIVEILHVHVPPEFQWIQGLCLGVPLSLHLQSPRLYPTFAVFGLLCNHQLFCLSLSVSFCTNGRCIGHTQCFLGVLCL